MRAGVGGDNFENPAHPFWLAPCGRTVVCAWGGCWMEPARRGVTNLHDSRTRDSGVGTRNTSYNRGSVRPPHSALLASRGERPASSSPHGSDPRIHLTRSRRGAPTCMRGSPQAGDTGRHALDGPRSTSPAHWTGRAPHHTLGGHAPLGRAQYYSHGGGQEPRCMGRPPMSQHTPSPAPPQGIGKGEPGAHAPH